MTQPRSLKQEIKDWYRTAHMCLLCLVMSIIVLLNSFFLALVFNYTVNSPTFHQIANIFEAFFFTSLIALIISAIWSAIVHA